MPSEKQLVRASFRTAVFERDLYRCKCCGFPSSPERAEEELDAHHITDRTEMPGGGYVPENGITLCKEPCHEKAEVFHKSGGKSFEIGYHPSELYAKIGSSHDKALRASKKLKVA